ncbi:hypothetical protein K501DRAFT_190524 [Backusella circina FSU 941]|nr:hypothetical protein K501DRAFT_190524 [Backusella circina FSU 941]
MIVVLKWAAMATLFGILTFFTVFGIDFNTHVSLKEWISPVKVQHEPLVCFNNDTSPTIIKKNGIVPSVPVVEEFTCYDFASTLKSSIKQHQQHKTLFHTYWDSKVLTDKHIDTIRSFLATQDLDHSQLVIWTLDKAVLEQQIPKDEHIIIHDAASLVDAIPIKSNSKDWIQLTSLYKYGGVWFDMEVLFIRDMSPLLTQEWITEGGCKTKDFFNGIFVHFFKNSRYLCEVMHQFKQERSLAQAYQHTYHQLLENRIEPWSILPWCYTDPSNCQRSNSLPSAFQSNVDFSKSNLQKVFAYHYHSSLWNAKPGTLYKYLVNQHKNKISWF